MSKTLSVHNLPQHVDRQELAGATVVVIDLLRASSTICTALANGATEVVPFLEVEDARKAAADDRSNIILGGERGGNRIDGFDLGNSPAEYTSDRVQGKRVFFTTTNGTRALEHARLANRIVVGALVNLSAVAESIRDADNIQILCAGTDEKETSEDILAAGALVARLTNASSEWNATAEAQSAFREWQSILAAQAASWSFAEYLAEVLRNTPGGKNLLAIGHEHDLHDCARIDSLQVVPEFHPTTGRITLR